MRLRNPLVHNLAAFAATVAIASALGACNASQGPATSSPAPTGSAPPAARTLRTIAEEPETASRLTVGRELATNDKYTTHAATYASDGLTISAVLHEPKAPGRHPGIVLVHGFVEDPASYASGGDLKREQESLARAGYVVLYTDLRGLGASDPAPAGAPDLDMGSTEDVLNAVRALAQSGLPSLDSERIGLLGHSLGGLLVINVLVARPGLVDAVVAFAPSSTVASENLERYLHPGEPFYEALVAAHGTPATNKQYWADVSPRTFIDKVKAPLLIVQGDADEDTAPQWSTATVAEWRVAGKDATLVTLKGENHVFEARWAEAMSAVTAFFAAHL